VQSFDGDAMLVKAAQQWTFDALWPVLDGIKMRKVFIPCGFSGLFDPDYTAYFIDLPEILKKFDQLIFYSENYRDIEFARVNGLTRMSILTNGASELEFDVVADEKFREKHAIADRDFVFITVGAPIASKGHREAAEAFALLDTGGRTATLILNGNWPNLEADWPRSSTCVVILRAMTGPFWAMVVPKINLAREGLRLLRERGLRAFAAGVGRRWSRMRSKKCMATTTAGGGSVSTERGENAANQVETFSDLIVRIRSQPKKRVLRTNFSRPDLIQALMSADLFVFASHVEYSPLVLFEAVAAGTPFLSAPVGNAEEIAQWTGGGIVFPAEKDVRGFTRVDPMVLTSEMARCMSEPERLKELGNVGKINWRKHFTWSTIAQQYEAILSGHVGGCRPTKPKGSTLPEKPVERRNIAHRAEPSASARLQ
jgi:glycosyltransferase involved in cell wall biosynthesis